MEKEAVGKSGIGLGTVIFVVFLILRLVGVINWDWMWVLSPIWIPLALTLLICGSLVFIVGVATFIKNKK